MPKKKQLNCTVDEFYLYCMLMYGKPRHSDLIRHSIQSHIKWFSDFDKGKTFTQCVTNCGEATSRSKYWFERYLKWYERQEAKQHVQRVQVQNLGRSKHDAR